MPALGRWAAADPLADKYPGWSSYVYALNTPTTLIDPFGLEPQGQCDQRNAAGRISASCRARQEQQAATEARQAEGTHSQDQQSSSDCPVHPGPRPDYPECSGTARCTHWRLQKMLWDQKYREWKQQVKERLDALGGAPDDLADVLLVGIALSGAPASGSPRLSAFTGGKTAGVLRTSELGDVALVSGRAGPAASIPRGTRGFDGYTKTHVEGHAAALMRQHGISEATLYINNPDICSACTKLLSRMLPDGARVTIVTPTQTVVFTGLP